MILFSNGPLSELLRQTLDAAVRNVDGFDLAQLSNPAIAGQLDQLWNSSRPRIPELMPEQRKGTMREETQTFNDYGTRSQRQVTMVDVRIPFRGDREMFLLSPSSCTMIPWAFSVMSDELVHTMGLDPSEDDKLNKAIAQIQSNLKTMRQEEEAFAQVARRELGRVAENRTKKLSGDKAVIGKLNPLAAGNASMQFVASDFRDVSVVPQARLERAHPCG